MVGNNIRSIRHLFRIATASLCDILISFKDGSGIQFCKVFKTEATSPFGEMIFIFNHSFNYGDYSMQSVFSSRILPSDLVSVLGFKYGKLLGFAKHNDDIDFPYIDYMVLLPLSFEKDYHDFATLNTKLIRSLTSKYGYTVDDNISKFIYMYSDGSKNFYQWAINSYFQNNTSLSSIKRVLSWNESYGQLTKNLSKSTITAYTSNNDIFLLANEMSELRKEKRVNDAINSFNTAQKKMLKKAKLSEKDKSTIAKFYHLSEAKKTNFIQKVSTIDDLNELMRQMRHITSTHFDWNKDSFMDFISNVENIKFEIVLNENDIILLRVNDYETVKHLAKTTNWCISKNKTYWNQYVENQNDCVQYMLFDFSKKEDDLLSIIGFTTQYNKGITHAHDFNNNDMMKQDTSTERLFLNSFLSQHKRTNNIYQLLNCNGFDITLVAHYDKPLFNWDKESMYSYLYECVKKDNVDILYDKDNLVALSVFDRNLRYFMGDTYIDTISEKYWGKQHIIFMDFSMSQYDPNRIQFGIIISDDGASCEDYCLNMFNEHSQYPNVDFNTKLVQYHLPYDIIRRSDNKYDKIKNSFISFNVPMLNESITDNGTLIETLQDYVGEDVACDLITSSIVDNMSFDYLDLFYSRGLTINRVMGIGMTSNLIINVFNSFLTHFKTYHRNNTCYDKPTDDEIEAFYNKNLDSYEKSMYIGCYLALFKIIEKEGENCENPNYIFRKITNSIYSLRNTGEIFDSIMEKVAQYLDFKRRVDTTSSWIFYAFKSKNEKLNAMLKELAEKYDAVKVSISTLESQSKKQEVFTNVNTTFNNRTIFFEEPVMNYVTLYDDRQ